MRTTLNKFGHEWYSDTHTKYDNSDYDHAYFGPDGVISTNTSILLKVVEKPVEFERGDIFPHVSGDPSDDLITKEYCCGEVISEPMSYGTYTWKVKMPETPNLWPALWLCGYKSWPPEIDVVEGYTRKGGYIRNIINTSLNTNAHYRKKEEIVHMKPSLLLTVIYKLFHRAVDKWKYTWTEDSIKVYFNGIRIRTIKDKDLLNDLNADASTIVHMKPSHLLTVIYKLFHRPVDEWKCTWTKDSIKVYFNGIRIRTIKDKDLLNDLNADASMQVIMNIMITEGYKHDPHNEPTLNILDFEYKPL